MPGRDTQVTRGDVDYYACSPPDQPEPPYTEDKCVFCRVWDMCWPEDEIRCSYCGDLICHDCRGRAIREGDELYCSEKCRRGEE